LPACPKRCSQGRGHRRSKINSILGFQINAYSSFENASLDLHIHIRRREKIKIDPLIAVSVGFGDKRGRRGLGITIHSRCTRKSDGVVGFAFLICRLKNRDRIFPIEKIKIDAILAGVTNTSLAVVDLRF
jgi:hypothetical protein